MQFRYRRLVVLLTLILCCAVQAQVVADGDDTIVTLIFTNDIESAYDPVPAWWLEDMEQIGGIAQLATLIANVRATEPNVFLFDAGDIFKIGRAHV